MEIEERLLRVKGSTLGGSQRCGKRGWGEEGKPNAVIRKHGKETYNFVS